MAQTVRLNTPGQQDGGFELVVNGQRIMRRDDIFYRDVPSSSNGNDGGGDGGGGSPGNGGGGWGGDGGDGDDGGDGSGSGDDDGGLLGDLLRRENDEVDGNLPPVLLSGHPPSTDESRWAAYAPLFAPEAVPDTPGKTGPIQQTETLTAIATMTQSVPSETSTASIGSSQVQMESQSDTSGAIGFSGIFFR